MLNLTTNKNDKFICLKSYTYDQKEEYQPEMPHGLQQKYYVCY